MAKSSKRPNIREYSNCCRLVHHQKSISQFRGKDGSVPCAEDGKLAEKRNASFLFNLAVLIFLIAVLIFLICLTVVVGCDRMGLALVGKMIKNQKDDEDE